MDKEELTINVDLTETHEVVGTQGKSLMVLFSGYADCENFKGKILSGGVDTQLVSKDFAHTLSARYTLEGKDCDGQNCKIFIENQGTVENDGTLVTTPKIYTDSKRLSYLEKSSLYGTITPNGKGIVIHIFSREQKNSDLLKNGNKTTVLKTQKILDFITEQSEKKPAGSRAIVALSGGSGSGKTTVAEELRKMLFEKNKKALVVHGDEYAIRIPLYNDAERISLFRNAGLKALLESGEYTSERAAKIQKWQNDFIDASVELCEENAWYKQYLSAGRAALEKYLGTEEELDFESLQKFIDDYKSGKPKSFIRILGRKEGVLHYEETDLEDIDVVILEWTHGGNPVLTGIDWKIFLEGTPEQTVTYRCSRNKDPNADSAFVAMVLDIEQAKIKEYAKNASLVVPRIE